jgi:uncharacterized protein YndB with AHSA1/START domain
MLKSETGFELSIARSFDAPIATVFEIWTTREHVSKWWAPKTFENGGVEWDFRVGGAYRVGISSEKYGLNWMGGRFVEIVPNRRIVFTFAWEANDSIGNETLITVSFEERDGKTVQTFLQSPFQSADTRDSHVDGWGGVLEREAAYAERLAQNG